jgi:hypothetical protein
MKLLKRRSRETASDGPITFYIPEHVESEQINLTNWQTSTGVNLEPRISELLSVGRFGYVGTPGENFDEHYNNIKAREIGDSLDKLGGMDLMLAVHARVVEKLGAIKGRELEACWGGIGSWRR